MTATQMQMALPGMDDPNPLAEAREEYRQLRAAWQAVAHLRDSDERSRLQPLVAKAAIRVDCLESGRKWWHG